MGKNEEAKRIKGEQEAEVKHELSVKIRGESLTQLIAIRADREKREEKIMPAAEVVREAIENLYKITAIRADREKTLKKMATSAGVMGEAIENLYTARGGGKDD